MLLESTQNLTSLLQLKELKSGPFLHPFLIFMPSFEPSITAHTKKPGHDWPGFPYWQERKRCLGTSVAGIADTHELQQELEKVDEVQVQA